MHEHMNTKYCMDVPKTGCTSTWILNISWIFQRKDAWTCEYKILPGCSKDRMQEHNNAKHCMDTSKDEMHEHINTEYCMSAPKTGCTSSYIQNIAWMLQRQNARAHEYKILHGCFKRRDAQAHEYKILHGCSKDRMHEHMNTKNIMDAPKTGCTSAWIQNISWMLQRQDARARDYRIVNECSKDGMHEHMATK